MAKAERLLYVISPRKHLKPSEYLAVRPDFELEGKRPLFYTDYGGRFDRKEIYRFVIYYKKKAGINKQGGAHVLFRHTPASLMIQNGCDLLTIQHVLRHNDIKTSMRYLHLADDTRRSNYDKFLKLLRSGQGYL